MIISLLSQSSSVSCVAISLIVIMSQMVTYSQKLLKVLYCCNPVHCDRTEILRIRGMKGTVKNNSTVKG